jgi:uncharacterized membrane protein YdfJ with MMPL/SSD domain
MRALMERLEGFVDRHRRLVVAAWLVVVVAALPFASKQTENLTGGGFDVPGSDSKAVVDGVEADFAGSQPGMAAVLVAQRGATEPQIAAAVKRLQDAAGSSGDAEVSAAAASEARAALSAKGEAVVPIIGHVSPDKMTDVAVDLRDDVPPGEAQDGVTTYYTGQAAAWAGLQELSREDLAKAEAAGFPIVALILLAVFGSFAAAALPLGLGFGSVIVTGALIFFISRQLEMSVFVTNMASMVGIGVAVDYSLFILARFREEVRDGRSAAEARARAMTTSGLAVVFSGVAVIVSLASLWMVDNQALRSMALGAMIVVAISILTATTLLPALIRVLGYRVEAGGVPWKVISFFRHLGRRRRRAGSTSPDRPDFWHRWTERVMARPWLSVGAVSAVMLTLAIPVLSMETGTGALDQFPADHDVRVGTELAADIQGGSTDPVQLLADFGRGSPKDPANTEAIASMNGDLARDPGVESVAPPQLSPHSALLQASPRGASDSDASFALVDRVRDSIVPGSALAQRAQVDVGGETARAADVRSQISGSMIRIILFVLAFSFVVLMVMLRSLLLPLKAILMNLLSIGAAYGVLVVVFQWGWLDGLFGFQSIGTISTINPPLILAIVFGLSMDYEVFLLSRIREHYLRHGDNRRAVAEGLASSARTISSAALIMTAVFSVFALTGVPSIKEIGLGTAVAIALDATLVRLILVPAAMQLMGRWNWWLPSWMDRLVPRLNVEAPEGERTLPAES